MPTLRVSFFRQNDPTLDDTPVELSKDSLSMKKEDLRKMYLKSKIVETDEDANLAAGKEFTLADAVFEMQTEAMKEEQRQPLSFSDLSQLAHINSAALILCFIFGSSTTLQAASMHSKSISLTNVGKMSTVNPSNFPIFF